MNTSTTLSLLSTTCWVVALIPQLVHNFRCKSVAGLSPYLLLLWFMGDFCNMVGCVLTDQLPFQTYLSFYFLLNDICLDIQYVYYHKTGGSNTLTDDESTQTSSIVEMISSDDDNEDTRGDNYEYQDTYASTRSNSFKPSILTKTQVITTTTALLSVSPTTALPLSILSESNLSSPKFNIGLFFAWFCASIYCSSRLPQLYHNYTRKSVDGISPLLFTFAVLANLTYALSILFSNDIPPESTYHDFIWKEMPYLMGSLGTVCFDGIYFWQREIYRVVV